MVGKFVGLMVVNTDGLAVGFTVTREVGDIVIFSALHTPHTLGQLDFAPFRLQRFLATLDTHLQVAVLDPILTRFLESLQSNFFS